MNKTIILLLLLIIPLASAELIGDGTNNVVTGISEGSESMTDSTYGLFVMVEDLAKANITDNTYTLCVGLRCQMFRAEEVAAEEPGPTGGGGGGIYEGQGNISVEDFSTSLALCVEQGGIPVNIKGGIFCKIGDTYIPIEQFKEETSIFGIKIPNLGAMVSSNTIVGWAAIFVVIIGSLVFIVRIRQSKSDKEVRRELIKQKRAEEEGRNQKT